MRARFDRAQTALWLTLLPLASLASPTSAIAASPAVVIASAPLIAPDTALTTYGSPASPSAKATRDPLIQETSRALKYDVDLIYEHVRDSVETLPMFGLLKGGRGVAIDGKGTPFDQAQFMVDALREADAVASRGYNPSYKLGKITLTAAEFNSWTGINDAAIATKYLANAGVPATITGSGSNFTVVMLHVWVQATIGGTAYLFDPSYKPSTQQAGLNWQANTSYNKTNLLGDITGTTTTVTNFSSSAFKDKLSGYRTNLENFIATNALGKRAEAVVGTSRITPHTTAENRRTSLPYVTSTDRTWVGEVPDAFRTSFTVALNGQTYGTYFADEKGGAVISFSYSGSGSTFTKGAAGSQPVVAGSFLSQCEEYLGSQSAATATVTVDINHPYVANSQTYGDRTISRQIARQQCSGGSFYVSSDWGYVGDGIGRRIGTAASLVRSDPTRKTDFVFAPTLSSVSSQYSNLLELAGRAQDNVYQLHDLVGIHVVDNAALQRVGTVTSYDLHSFLSMSFESAVSAFSKANTTAADTTAAYTAGLGLSIAEAAVPRQESDAVYDMAAINLFADQFNRSASGGSYNAYRATTSSAWTTVKNSLTGYPSAALTAIDGYVGEGYSVLVPKKGDLRQPPITVNSATSATTSLWEGYNTFGNGGEMRRAAFLAVHPGASSIPDRLSVSIYDSRRGSVIKAGVGVAAATGTNNDPIRKPEPPKAEGKDLFRAALNVDPRTGSVSYAAPTDLTDGAGEFPQSLELKRVYDSKDLTNYGFGIGWKSNWYQVATLSNDGQAALGRSNAMGVASALVMLQAMGDLVTTQNAKELYGALQVASWFTDQTINNTVVLQRGLDAPETFYKRRNADGTYSFISGRPDGSTLTVSGAPSTGIINRRLYDGYSVSYTDGAGTIRTYLGNTAAPSYDLSWPSLAQLYARKSFYLDNWAFPNGIKIKTAYDSTTAAPDVTRLVRVTNNMGSAIYQSGYDYGSSTDEPYCATPGGLVLYHPPRPAYIKYRTASGSEVNFAMDAQVGWTVIGDPDNLHCPQGSLNAPKSMFQVMSGLQGMTDAGGSSWSYAYTQAPGLFGATPSLSALYKPSLGSTPAILLAYGLDTNVRTMTDANSNSWKYHSLSSRSEVISPLQASANVGAVTYFDRDAQAIRSVDPLGRTTTTSYDDRGRPTTVTRPEGDQTVTTYDVRGNVLTETKKAKTGTGLPDRVTTTTYVEGSAVTSCTSIATCNKPLTVTDPVGNRSDYSWNSTTGNLISLTQGLNGSAVCQISGGTCPQTSFTYTSLAGYDPDPVNPVGGTLVLPATKQVRIDASNNTTTAYDWVVKDFSPVTYVGMSSAAVKKAQVRGVTVDNGGLNLRTCYTSDLIGNVVSVTEPKEGLSVCP